MVDKLRAEGAGQKLAGRVKEAAGKITGDAKLQADGRADKTAGGGAIDSVKEAANKAKH